MVVYARKKGEAKQTPQDEGQFDEQLLLLFSKSVLFLVMLRYITTDKGRGKCFCPCSFVCLSVCLLARLLKNACMDLDEMLRVDIMSGHVRTD